VTRIAEVPASFDDRTFDQFAQAFGAWPPEERMLFDARAAQWASPYGLIGLLTAGQALREAHREKPLFTVPASDEVRRYWARTGFFRHAADLFEIHGKVPRVPTGDDSDLLLDITAVGASEDVHQVVGRIQERAAHILRDGKVGLEAKATMGFAMALSEACQNIVEHAGTSGWVAVHAYHWRKRLGRWVAMIAVSDAGLGFRRSLEATQAKRFGDRWGDATALEAALIQGVSRFRDPGRGQGLAGIKRYLTRWQGKISIRSGTARLSIVPEWDDDVPLADHLPFFPGSQVQIVIPAQEGGAR
jgi:anti-sigma regulatory factor (Ser/Thr protein kinase)